MGRVLKFRTWDNANNEWLNKEDAKCLTIYLDGRYEIDRGWVKVFPDLIFEQYTGLKDKNGKEIYEGDIVKAKIQGFWETGPNTICEGKVTWNLEVVYNEIRYMVVFHILGSKNAPDRIYYLFDKELSELEVIGNIHENPELLENK